MQTKYTTVKPVGWIEGNLKAAASRPADPTKQRRAGPTGKISAHCSY